MDNRDAAYTGLFVFCDGVASESDSVEPLGDQAEGVVLAGCSPAPTEEPRKGCLATPPRLRSAHLTYASPVAQDALLDTTPVRQF